MIARWRANMPRDIIGRPADGIESRFFASVHCQPPEESYAAARIDDRKDSALGRHLPEEYGQVAEQRLGQNSWLARRDGAGEPPGAEAPSPTAPPHMHLLPPPSPQHPPI